MELFLSIRLFGKALWTKGERAPNDMLLISCSWQRQDALGLQKLSHSQDVTSRLRLCHFLTSPRSPPSLTLNENSEWPQENIPNDSSKDSSSRPDEDSAYIWHFLPIAYEVGAGTCISPAFLHGVHFLMTHLPLRATDARRAASFRI